eukprot:10014360-Ditylum_brightwellii.AAC.1
MPSPWKWPHQQYPNAPIWILWEKAKTPVVCNDSRYLKQPLGLWTSPRAWITRYSPADNKVYMLNTSWKWHAITKTTRQLLYASPQ